MVIAIAVVACPAYAYETQTHADMSQNAAESSSTLSEYLPNLGLRTLRDKISDGRNEFEARGWIREGAQREDDTFSESFARYRNHFFDPTPSAPNNGGFTGVLIPGLFSGLPAPDWALEPTPISGQIFGFKDARRYLLDALTNGTKADRDASLALTFRTIGQVIHLVQDMGQPQHTRNDAHGIPASLFERYTEQVTVRQRLKFDGFPVPQFSEARGFFANDQGTGLAQYTNQSFVTQGTSFRWDGSNARHSARYSYPTPLADIELTSIANENVPQALKDYCGQDPGCSMRFYSSVNNRGDVQKRAATLSIFADDLQQFNIQDPNIDASVRFSFNSLNFEAVLPNLIPRAVAYSVGMINYFFRGKIDIVPDPANSGAHLIRNLGSEVMAGKFALFYDANDGSRKPVPALDGGSLAWDTRIILADTEGQLLPNDVMHVTGFIEPVDVKKPGGYMLVFVGTLGEESADEPEDIGAVAAKFIPTMASSEALYLAGLDAAGNYVGVRVDKDGSKILAGEFDPLRNFVTDQTLPSTYFERHRSQLIQMKQVAFTQSITGPSYQTLAVSLSDPLSKQSGFVWRTGTGSFVTSAARVWLAVSPDPAIGEFHFAVLKPPSGPNVLQYFREFVDAAGVRRIVSGELAFPALGGFPGGTNIAFSMGNDLLPVSVDGLHVGHFVKIAAVSNTGDSFNFQRSTTREIYELEIGLSAIPTLQLRKLDSWQDTTSQTEIWSTTFPFPPLSISGTNHQESRLFLGYFNGVRQMLRAVNDSNWSGSGSRNALALCNSSLNFDNYEKQSTSTSQFPIGSFGYTETCKENVGKSLDGRNVADWITHRAADALYHEPPFSGPLYAGDGTLLYAIGDHPPVIFDSSPLGESFFAKTDLSLVIHKPRAGGMPQVVIPPNVVRLLAALWL